MSVPTHWFDASDPDVYEKFMARWSARLADPFLTFAGILTGQRVLDVGCGTGTITLALAERGCSVVGTDASESYLEGARRRRSHPAITYELGDAQNLAYPSGSFDACVSTLAIDVVPEPKKFAAEMRRVTRAGGIVACGTFDFWGGFSAAEHIIEIGATLDEDMRVIRDYRRARPLFWPNGMARLWRDLGLTDVTEVPIVISFDFESFDDTLEHFHCPGHRCCPFKRSACSRGSRRLVGVSSETCGRFRRSFGAIRRSLSRSTSFIEAQAR